MKEKQKLILNALDLKVGDLICFYDKLILIITELENQYVLKYNDLYQFNLSMLIDLDWKKVLNK